jgi:hypothetical protein
VALSFLAKPDAVVLGAALRTRTTGELLALITGADADGDALLAGESEVTALHHAVPRWRDRLAEIPGTARLAAGRTADRGWSCRPTRSGRRNSMAWVTRGRCSCGYKVAPI